MRCVICKVQKTPIRLGGIISITCCGKIQILKYTLRPRLRDLYKNDPEVILVE